MPDPLLPLLPPAHGAAGVVKHGQPLSLDDPLRVDLIVVGSVAVDPETGCRQGREARVGWEVTVSAHACLGAPKWTQEREAGCPPNCLEFCLMRGRQRARRPHPWLPG